MASSQRSHPSYDDLAKKINESLDNGKLPFNIFGDEEIYELEMERIFRQGWLLVGHESEIPDKGDYVKRHLADSPFIFVRDNDGSVQVLFDSCTHRGTTVCRADEGNATHFRCPYHGWTFKNNGELVGIPFKEQCYEKMDKDEFGLMSAPKVEEYGGFVFASLDPGVPEFEEYLGEYKWYLDAMLNLPESGWEVIGEPLTWTFDGNWKIGCDNFSGDSYHNLTAHHSALAAGFSSADRDAKDVRSGGETSFTKNRRKHQIVCGSHHLTYGPIAGEGTNFFGASEEVIDSFSRENLTDDQWELIESGAIMYGVLFPNVSWTMITVSDSVKSDVLASFRKMIPISETETKFINWYLAPKGVSEETKQRLLDVGRTTFSPTGTHEQDDAAIWEWITEAADSSFAKQHDIETNYQMGTEVFGESNILDDDEFLGPGAVSEDPFTEHGARNFFKTWAKAIGGEQV